MEKALVAVFHDWLLCGTLNVEDVEPFFYAFPINMQRRLRPAMLEWRERFLERTKDRGVWTVQEGRSILYNSTAFGTYDVYVRYAKEVVTLVEGDTFLEQVTFASLSDEVWHTSEVWLGERAAKELYYRLKYVMDLAPEYDAILRNRSRTLRDERLRDEIEYIERWTHGTDAVEKSKQYGVAYFMGPDWDFLVQRRSGIPLGALVRVQLFDGPTPPHNIVRF